MDEHGRELATGVAGGSTDYAIGMIALLVPLSAPLPIRPMARVLLNQ
jgi:hypothetical protein